MRPESASVTFRDDIAALVQEYMDEKAKRKFIGRRVAPIFRHPELSGQYPIFRRDGFKKRTDDTRTAEGGYKNVVFEFGSGTFDTNDRGLETLVDQRVRKQYRRLFDAEVAAVKPLVNQIMLNHEYRIASLFANTSFSNTNVATAWSVAASATPLTDLQTGIDALCDRCGCDPSDISLIIPRDDYKQMLACTQVANKTQYTYPGMIPSQLSPDEIAQMLKIKQTIVARSAQDTTEEGYAENNSQIWPAGVIYLAVLAEDGDDLAVPSVARTIVYDGLEDDLESVEIEATVDDFLIIESYEQPGVRGRKLRVRAEYDQIIQLADDPDVLCYKLTNT
jgi:hypothetical protein